MAAVLSSKPLESNYRLFEIRGVSLPLGLSWLTEGLIALCSIALQGLLIAMKTNASYRTFQEVFVSNFHNSLSFDDFLNLSVDKNIEVTQIKEREIVKPSERLKRILHFLAKNVFDYGIIATEVVFSYRKGVNVRDAVLPHSKNKFFFQTDISNFFSSITKPLVRNSIRNGLGSVPISDVHEYLDVILNLVSYKNGLPLGFPTSPAISNMCLLNFDKELLIQSNKLDVSYTRYADDIILSADNEEVLRKLAAMVSGLLQEFVGAEIKLNETKTRCLQKVQKVKLLGVVILPNGQISIDRADKVEIETLLHFYLTNDDKFLGYGLALKNKKTKNDKIITRENVISMLSGRLIGANAMAPEYLLKLRQKYGNTSIDMFLHKSAK